MATLTIAQYKTKLNTHATTAGAAWFLYGWFDEINSQEKVRAAAENTPFIVVEPTQWAINPKQNEFSITFKCNGYVNHATSREASLDSLTTVLSAFVTAINGDSNLAINEGDIITNLIDFGTIVKNYYVIGFETTIDIIC